MSFDPRSLERLRQLGRSLPQPLPLPDPPRRPGKAEPARHRVETEQDPEQLFRELMQASADGSVPPHLLDRLRQLESQGQQPASAAPEAGSTSNRRGGKGRRAAATSGGDGDLYTTFQQLLLEEDDA